MGYESKIFIVEDNQNFGLPIKEPYFAEIIASFDLCKMPYDSGFHQLFDTPAPFYIFAEGPNEPTQVDRYDEPIKYADFDKVVWWCESFVRVDNYRRIPPFLASLKGFDRSKWKTLRIVHYGH